VHICGGVSNASYGLPERRYVNLALTVLAIFAGMDYAIIDPCVPGTAGLIAAAEALAGNDESCRAYIAAAREGRLS
jgi:5-methyltetrahydrofolate--homocysteine methyltransferase